MNEFTPFLAILIVVAHLIAIFWPRKPLPGLIDENGLPDIWRNREEIRQDVTCIWREKASESVVSESSQPGFDPVTSFRSGQKPVAARNSDEQRSVA